MNRLQLLPMHLAALVALTACDPAGNKDHRGSATAQQASADQNASTSSAPTATTPQSTATGAPAAPQGTVDEKVTPLQMKQFFAATYSGQPLDTTTAANQQPAADATIPVVQAAATAMTTAPLTPTEQGTLLTTLQQAFASRMAAHPGVLTTKQAQDLSVKLSDFIQTAKMQNSGDAAAKWNVVMDTLSTIKKARTGKGLALSGTVPVGIYGNYAGGPVAGLAGLLGNLVGGIVGGVAGTAVNVVGGVASTAVGVVGGVAQTAVAVAAPVIVTGAELLQTTLTIVPVLVGTVAEAAGAVVGTALALVGGIVDGVFSILLG